MPVNVGIPRALLFHEFGELWQGFFHNLATPVHLSAETNRQMLDCGTKLAIDESCLPLKLYLGHVETLLDNCSHIFVPRIIRYHRDFYLCAKFAGLPDIVKNTFHLPDTRIIAPDIETNWRVGYYNAIKSVAAITGKSTLSGEAGFRKALADWRQLPTAPAVSPFQAQVAVVGHGYILKDDFLSREIFATLRRRGVAAVTPDALPRKMIYDEARRFAPDLYWQLSAKLAGATAHFASRFDIAGIILVSSFGCGLDSMMNEYLEYHVLRNCGKPYLMLNLDEHTGWAGITTRLEAFWDMVEWRRKN